MYRAFSFVVKHKRTTRFNSMLIVNTFNIRSVLLALGLSALYPLHSQTPERFKTDSLLLVKKNLGKGFTTTIFYSSRKERPSTGNFSCWWNRNNTGKITDSMEVHTEHAIALASVSSVGNNISTELRIPPCLFPFFQGRLPNPLPTIHALDRDVMEETTPG